MNDPKMENAVAELTELVNSHYFGKYRGLVKKIEDKDKRLGQIQATVPEVYGDEDSPWIWPCVPFAGKKYGFVTLPKEGDGVWIEFEAGDPNRPIWTGFWWAKDEMPEVGGQNAAVLVTKGGHKLILDDEKKELKLVHSKGGDDGPQISMTEDSITLQVGNTKLVLSKTDISINGNAFKVTS